jgi:hypothetical protein
MRRTPNFIYLGPPKAGSTWLFEWMRSRDDIFVLEAKETKFFDAFFDRGLPWYLRHFAQASHEEIVAEVCHTYLYAPLACERMRAALGDIQLMVTLREPVDQLFSRYLFARRNGLCRGSFRQYLADRPQVVDRQRYHRFLRPYLDRFGRERIHVASFDLLRESPQAFADQLCDYLVLPRRPLETHQYERSNAAAEARNAWAARLAKLSARKVRSWGGTTIVQRVKGLLRNVLYRPLRPGPGLRIDPELAEQLHASYRTDVLELDRILDSNFTGLWRYG